MIRLWKRPLLDALLVAVVLGWGRRLTWSLQMPSQWGSEHLGAGQEKRVFIQQTQGLDNQRHCWTGVYSVHLNVYTAAA